MIKRLAIAATGLLSLCAGTAHATWSILIVDTRTGEIGLGSATCLVGLDLREVTPVLVAGLGGLTAQSAGDSRGVNRTFVRDRMIEGVDPEEIINLLAVFDPGHESRQYGMVDVHGGAATFSGSLDGQWAGGVVGQVGDLVYAIQGNVLTGNPVVAMAEQAVIGTPGDLSAKLMAGMEAARSMGGDGRCSCRPSQPEDCGSPPPDFEKSADVGYMLVARLGDFSAAYGVYDAGGLPWAETVLDFDGDGRPDVLAALENSDMFTLLRNITPDGSAMAVLTEQVQFTGVASTRALLPGDFNADTNADFLIGSATLPGVYVILGDGAGNFTPDTIVPIGTTINALAEAMGGVAALSSASGELFILDPDNGFATLATINLGNAPVAVRPDPADASAAFVALAGTGEVLRLVRSGSTISIDRTIPIGTDLVSIETGDVNDDGLTDIFAVSGSSKQADLLLDDGVGGYAVQSFDLGRVGRSAMMADFDADGDIDPAAYTNGRANLHILQNNDNASYTLDSEKTIARGPRVALAHDMNADGFPDIVTGGISAAGVVIGDNAKGRFTELAGTAAGDFFMALNVADSVRQDPDPVFQLRDQFDEWRADLIGKVDAVQSSTQLDALAVPAGSGRDVALNITLRDWQLDAVTGPVNLRISAADGSDGVGTISAIEDLGGGHYRATITPGNTAGTDTLDIIADAGDRTVLLTPRPEFRVVEANGDFDGDGVISFYDIQAFLNAFAAGDLAADMNSDGTLDFSDVQIFLNIISG
jgi:uncharacterized Ntn-hydrolase superfamily protein